MNICGFVFTDLGSVEIQRDLNGNFARLKPQERFGMASGRPLHRHGSGEFCKFKVEELPSGPGVYVFASGGAPLYVGKAASIRKRFQLGYRGISPRMCYLGGPETTCRINALVLQETLSRKPVHVLVYETPSYNSVEETILASLLLPWNISGVLRC